MAMRRPFRRTSNVRAQAVQARAIDAVNAAGNERMAASNTDRGNMRARLTALEERITKLEQTVASLHAGIELLKPGDVGVTKKP